MQDYIVAYGSLMNRYSRERYSKIFSDVIPLSVNGWARSWSASYPDEGATYAGASRCADASLNGVLLPTVITDDIKQRERGYTFVELNIADLDLAAPLSSVYKESSNSGPEGNDQTRYWICELNSHAHSNEQNPVPQSYIDTCLQGCLEVGGIAKAKQFIAQTDGWDGFWLNDRGEQPIYPRSSPLQISDYQRIDELLDQSGVLIYRKN